MSTSAKLYNFVPLQLLLLQEKNHHHSIVPIPLPELGGDATQTSEVSCVPLDIVTGVPSPNTVLPTPKPKPPRASTCPIAEADPSSRSVGTLPEVGLNPGGPGK